MKAMIFAAGRGERMRPLTDHTPKPLLDLAGTPLIVWHLQKLAALGVREVVINIAHLAERIEQALGNGAAYGVRIHYSREPDGALETGGGLLHALPLLGDAPFLLVNGDVWTDFDFAHFPGEPSGLAHLLLANNPSHHPDGDFWLADNGRLHADVVPDSRRLTYAGIGLYRPELLLGWRSVIGHAPGARATPARFPLAPVLRAAMRDGRITGQHHVGAWVDVGTPQRLAELDAHLRLSAAHPG